MPRREHDQMSDSEHMGIRMPAPLGEVQAGPVGHGNAVGGECALLVTHVQRSPLRCRIQRQRIDPTVRVVNRLVQVEPGIQHQLPALLGPPDSERLVGGGGDQEAPGHDQARDRPPVRPERLRARLVWRRRLRVPHAHSAVGGPAEEQVAADSADARLIGHMHTVHQPRVPAQHLRLGLHPPRPGWRVGLPAPDGDAAVGQPGYHHPPGRHHLVARDRHARLVVGDEGAVVPHLHLSVSSHSRPALPTAVDRCISRK
mmetsp:Transcript_9041/g.29983  ORF Transcript_9041/g.29983 Transcript_9041/m.29983 type:complete len:257 (-) Transcript_9041:107-877(-)|eukprot:scaffold10790_cov99-Isochrysis_galbana.AAC.2